MADVFVAAVRLNFCERRPSPPMKNEKPNQEQVADDAAGNRGLHQFHMPLVERDDRDDELGRVAEGGIEEAAECRTRPIGEFLGAEPDDSGQRDERDRRGKEDPRRAGQRHAEHPGDRREGDEEIEAIGRDGRDRGANGMHA